jgi:hypothetical protein
MAEHEHGTHHHTGKEVAGVVLPLLRGGAFPSLREPEFATIAEGLRRAGLTGVVLDRLAGNGKAPGALLRKLERNRNQDRVSLTLLYDRLGRFSDTMKAAGIPFITLKGAALAPLLYGSVDLRPMVDVDVLIRHRDWPEVRDALTASGYRLPESKAAEYWLANYFNMAVTTPGEPPAYFDLHWSLGQEVRYAVDEDGIWSRAVPYEVEGREMLRLSDEDLLLNLLLHLGYHYFDARLLWLWDIRLLCLKRPIDWEVAFARARKWKMFTVFAIGLGYVEKVLPGSVPAEVLRAVRPGALRRALLGPLRSGEPDRCFRGDDRRLMQLVQGLLVMDSPMDMLRFMGDKAGRYLRFIGSRPRLK